VIWRALGVFVVVALGIAAVRFDVPLCPTALLFGIPCPGCGLTRATLALMSGSVGRAVDFHPLVFVLAPLFSGALAAAAVSFVRGQAPRSGRAWLAGRAVTAAGWSLLVLVLGVWIARFFGAFGGPVPVTTARSWLVQVAPNALDRKR
jgi:hypothetical protein